LSNENSIEKRIRHLEACAARCEEKWVAFYKQGLQERMRSMEDFKSAAIVKMGVIVFIATAVATILVGIAFRTWWGGV
jgi:predicted neutral ceramidase superfamily lipid hydrolase